jgi:SAM-dependent methyltransferase
MPSSYPSEFDPWIPAASKQVKVLWYSSSSYQNTVRLHMPPENDSTRRNNIAMYYQDKIEAFGPTHKGVDWNSVESQELRFSKLSQVLSSENFSVIDYGCGYGALHDYLSRHHKNFDYIGFDWSDAMLREARCVHPESSSCHFTSETIDESCDYSIASGIFNVKLEETSENWHQHILSTLCEIDRISKKGFSFNILTSYSDAEKQSQKLFYADPCIFFDFCKKNFARDVALLHDYGLYEFTIIVRKE